jgi:hypothetical protein
MDMEVAKGYRKASFVPICSKLLSTIPILFHLLVIYMVLDEKREQE